MVLIVVSAVFVLAVLAAGLSLRLTAIRSTSMRPALLEGDYVVVNRLARKFRRGDIVLFRFPTENPEHSVCGEKPYGKQYIKRVIGLPGEELEIRDRAVYVDGKRIEGAMGVVQRERIPSIKMPEGSYFVMGDNRARSCDSRVWGALPGKYTLGRAEFTIYPPDRRDRLVRQFLP